MQKLDLTLPTLAENLALDEALLTACEQGEILGNVLRLWESDHHGVVLGRSSDPAVEVNLAACRDAAIPVLRRVSGGGTILAGPGCLMYAVVLRLDTTLRGIDQAHQFVRGRLQECLAPLVPGIRPVGISDLALATPPAKPAPPAEIPWDTLTRYHKFSGNALRMKRTHLLYHGTLLYDFEIDRVTHLLAAATREPLYRLGRSHEEFVANLPVLRTALVSSLTTGWQASEPLADWPRERTAAIVREKYHGDPQWVIA